MKIILSPHRTPYFGQDFTIEFLIRHMGLVPVYLAEGEYDLGGVDISAVTLIISRYPDLAADALFIGQYGGRIPVVIHLHLHYRFLLPDQQQSLAVTISNANYRICNCAVLRDEYRALFPAYGWDFVNNGIDATVFHPAGIVERSAFRQRNGIPQDRVLLSYTGRLNEAKGLQLLEQVLAFVSGSASHFLVIQCIYLPKYEQVIAEIERRYQHVKIVTGQDVKAARFSDLHISTSLSETTSLVTLEALFSGVPVVCTDVTAFYQEIEKGYAPFPYFKKVDLPPAAIAEQAGKTGLKIAPGFVPEIAGRFIVEIENMSLLTEEQRGALGTNFSASAFNSAEMIRVLHAYYERISH